MFRLINISISGLSGVSAASTVRDHQSARKRADLQIFDLPRLSRIRAIPFE